MDIQRLLKILKEVRAFSSSPTSTHLNLSNSKLRLPSKKLDFEINVFSK